MNALLRAIFGDLEIAIFDTGRPTYESCMNFWNSPYFECQVRLTKCTIINRIFCLWFLCWSFGRLFLKINNQCFSFIIDFSILDRIVIDFEWTMIVNHFNFLCWLFILKFNNRTCRTQRTGCNDWNGSKLMVEYVVQWYNPRRS